VVPKLGSAFMLSFFRPSPGMVFIEWGPSDPFQYDFWMLRWAESVNEPPPAGDDAMWPQKNLHNYDPGQGPTHGSWKYEHNPALLGSHDGWYSSWFVVQGCDNPGNATCRQGWSPMTATRLFSG
jgi:hypothetical protein